MKLRMVVQLSLTDATASGVLSSGFRTTIHQHNTFIAELLAQIGMKQNSQFQLSFLDIGGSCPKPIIYMAWMAHHFDRRVVAQAAKV